MKDRRRKNHFEAIRPWFWACILFWVGAIWFGWQAYKAVQATMEPTVSAVSYVAEQVKR